MADSAISYTKRVSKKCAICFKTQFWSTSETAFFRGFGHLFLLSSLKKEVSKYTSIDSLLVI